MFHLQKDTPFVCVISRRNKKKNHLQFIIGKYIHKMNISSLHVCYIIKNFVETIYLSSTGPKTRLLGDTVHSYFCHYMKNFVNTFQHWKRNVLCVCPYQMRKMKLRRCPVLMSFIPNVYCHGYKRLVLIHIKSLHASKLSF